MSKAGHTEEIAYAEIGNILININASSLSRFIHLILLYYHSSR